MNETDFNSICVAFEADWKIGDRPRIETLLAQTPQSSRAALLAKLLSIELEWRRAEIPAATVENYLHRFPDFVDEVNAAWKAFEGRLFSMLTQPVHERQLIGEEETLAASAASYPTAVGDHVQYFGEYELLEEIARGGMGVVYRARQIKLNRIVAVKMILSGQRAGDEELKRFRGEAEAAAALDHPGIVPIYEIGIHEDQHYFSMGFVSGESLQAQLRDGPLPPRRSAEICIKVAEAVAYAHAHGVIHRDLKPGNILIDRSGVPRVTDFGLAKRVDSDNQLTQTGQVLGTPAYMPPEQALGKTGDIGPPADIYALGAVLYAMLLGRPPFQAASPLETLRQVVDQDPVAPSKLNREVPKDLETICMICLQKKPDARFQSVQQFLEELNRYYRGEPIKSRPIGRVEHAARWCKRNPLVASVSAALVLALVVGISSSTYFAIASGISARQASENAAEARLSQLETETKAAEASVARIVAEEARKDAENARLIAEREATAAKAEARRSQMVILSQKALSEPRPQQGVLLAREAVKLATNQVEAFNTGTRQAIDQALGRVIGFPLRVHEEQVTTVVVSPTKKWMLTASQSVLGAGPGEQLLKVWAIDERLPTKPRMVIQLDTNVTGFCFNRAEDRVYVCCQKHGIEEWDIESGEGRIVYPHELPEHVSGLAASENYLLAGAIVFDLSSAPLRPVQPACQCDWLVVSDDARWACGINIEEKTVVAWDLSLQNLQTPPTKRFELANLPGHVKSINVFSHNLILNSNAASIAVLASRDEDAPSLNRTPVSLWKMDTQSHGGEPIKPRALTLSFGKHVFAWDSLGSCLAATPMRKGQNYVMSWLPEAYNDEGEDGGVVEDGIRLAGRYSQPTTPSAIAVMNVQAKGDEYFSVPHIITGDIEGNLHVSNFNGGNQFKIQGHDNAILDLEPVPGTALVVSASQDGSIRVWDLAKYVELYDRLWGNFDPELEETKPGTFLHYAAQHQRFDHFYSPWSLRVDRYSKRFLVGHRGQDVSLFDLQNTNPWANPIRVSNKSETCLVFPGSEEMALVGRTRPALAKLDDLEAVELNTVEASSRNMGYLQSAVDFVQAVLGGSPEPEPQNKSYMSQQESSRLLQNGKYLYLNAAPPSFWKMDAGQLQLVEQFLSGYPLFIADRGFAISPDERWMLGKLKDEPKSILLYGIGDTVTEKILIGNDAIEQVAFCNNSKWVAAIQDETFYEDYPRVFVWRLPTEGNVLEPELVFEVPQERNLRLQIVTGGDDSHVIVSTDDSLTATNILSGKSFSLPGAIGHPRLVNGGKYLIAESSSGEGQLLFDTAKLTGAAIMLQSRPNYWSPDGNWFAEITPGESTALFHRTDSGFVKKAQLKSSNWLGIVAFSSNNQWAAGLIDDKLLVWYLGDGDGVPEPFQVDMLKLRKDIYRKPTLFFTPDSNWVIFSEGADSYIWPLELDKLAAFASSAAGRSLEDSTGPLPISIVDG